jgi:hypothetical protein
VNATERSALDTFFETTLVDGTSLFTMDDPVRGDNAKFMFGSTVTYTDMGGGNFKASFKLVRYAVTVQAFRDAAYPQETSEAFYALLKIEHDDARRSDLSHGRGGNLRRDARRLHDQPSSGDVYFSNIPLEIDRPDKADEQPSGKLTVPNVDQRIGQAIEDIDGPATVTVTVVLASDLTILWPIPMSICFCRMSVATPCRSRATSPGRSFPSSRGRVDASIRASTLRITRSDDVGSGLPPASL